MRQAALLELLDDVDRAGAGWTATCPACSSPSALHVYANIRGNLEVECDECPLADVLDAIEARRLTQLGTHDG